MDEAAAYARDAEEELPLGAYAGLMLTFAGGFGALLVRAARRGALPRRLRARDVLLLGIATHRLTRVIASDRVAAPIRAPFARYERSAGAGELHERPRGHGLRRALGGLLTCQFCVGPWAAAALTAGLIARPRETRIIAGMLTIATVSDFLHQAYALARRAS